MADEAEPEPKTERRACTLSVATLGYLEKLAKRGTHGSSVPKVMTSLIEEGIRQAIRERFISADDAADD